MAAFCTIKRCRSSWGRAEQQWRCSSFSASLFIRPSIKFSVHASRVGDSELSAEHRPVAKPPVLRGLLQEQPSLEESPTLSFATFALVSFEHSQTPGMSLAWAPSMCCLCRERARTGRLPVHTGALISGFGGSINFRNIFRSKFPTADGLVSS